VEISRLFGEGRAQTGRGTRAPGSAQRPLDFARSVARLGTSRGVAAFQRFGFLERNGQANLAVPLGRWQVSLREHQDLIDNVSDYVDFLRYVGRNDHAPSSLSRAARRCESALLAAFRAGTSSLRWQQVLVALGEAERCMLHSPKFTAEANLRPLPTLSPGWLVAASDASTEWRIAVALASLHLMHARQDISQGNRSLTVDFEHSIRRYALLLSEKDARRFATGEAGLLRSPDVVARGVDLATDMSNILLRHALHPELHNEGTLGLRCSERFALHAQDIEAFLRGSIDDAAVLDLAWPLMALDWRGARNNGTYSLRQDNTTHPSGALGPYALYREAVRLAPPRDARVEFPTLAPELLRALAAGQSKRASDIAQRRLKAKGFRCKGVPPSPPPAEAKRILAALLLPVRAFELTRLTRLVALEPEPEPGPEPTAEPSPT